MSHVRESTIYIVRNLEECDDLAKVVPKNGRMNFAFVANEGNLENVNDRVGTADDAADRPRQ